MTVIHTIPRDLWERMSDEQRAATFDRLCWRGAQGLHVMQRESRWAYFRRWLRAKVWPS